MTNVSDSGTWDSSIKTITWDLSNLESGQNDIYNFSMNCTTTGKHLLKATGMGILGLGAIGTGIGIGNTLKN